MLISVRFLLLIGLILVGCASKTIPDVVYQDQNNMVRLEVRPPTSPFTPEDDFQHPLTLTEEELTVLLRSIRVEESRGFFSFFKKTPPASLPAFSREEAQRMAGPLAAALGRAKPNERVTFLFTLPRGRFLSDVTSGVLFAKGERLHLILGRYRGASRPHEKDITLTSPALPSPPYHGFRLSAGPHQALVAANESPIWKEPTGTQHWVMIDYRAILAQPATQEAFPTIQEPKDTTESKEGADDLKEKLRLLRELRDENLITEEEYEKKRQELLKGF
jgi:hypothetical protein